VHSTISRSSSGWEWKGIGNCQLENVGMGFKFQMGMGMGMGMGIKSNEIGGNCDEKSVPAHLRQRCRAALL